MHPRKTPTSDKGPSTVFSVRCPSLTDLALSFSFFPWSDACYLPMPCVSAARVLAGERVRHYIASNLDRQS